MSQTESGGRADTRTAAEIPATAKRQVSRRQDTPANGPSRRCRRCGRAVVHRRAGAAGRWHCETAVEGDIR